MICTALVLLTRDSVLRDYVLADTPLVARAYENPSSLSRDDTCIVDADTIPLPYPPSTCLLIARKPLKTNLKLCLRPLAPRDIERALLSDEDEPPLQVMKQAHIIMRGGATVSFSPFEFALVCALLDAEGTPLSREALCRHIEGRATHTDNCLTVYIYRIRKKLLPLGYRLVSHHRLGYSVEKIKTL